MTGLPEDFKLLQTWVPTASEPKSLHDPKVAFMDVLVAEPRLFTILDYETIYHLPVSWLVYVIHREGNQAKLYNIMSPVEGHMDNWPRTELVPALLPNVDPTTVCFGSVDAWAEIDPDEDVRAIAAEAINQFLASRFTYFLPGAGTQYDHLFGSTAGTAESHTQRGAREVLERLQELSPDELTDMVTDKQLVIPPYILSYSKDVSIEGWFSGVWRRNRYTTLAEYSLYVDHLEEDANTNVVEEELA